MGTPLEQLIARPDLYLTPIDRMIDADAKGEESFPDGCEFTEEELESMDSQCRKEVMDLLETEILPDEGEWCPPVRYAYKHGYRKPGRTTWLKCFRTGIVKSKDFLTFHQNQT